MDAAEVAAALNAYWRALAGPPPDDETARIVWSARTPPPVVAIPSRYLNPWLLWDASTTSPIEYMPNSSPTPPPPQSGQAPPEPAPRDLRMLFARATTVDRPNLVLPRMVAEPPSPAAAARVCTYTLTARAVADDLDERAKRTGSPHRSLHQESAAYRAAADEQESLLGEVTTGWLEAARAAIAAAAAPPTSPTRRRYERRPVNL